MLTTLCHSSSSANHLVSSFASGVNLHIFLGEGVRGTEPAVGLCVCVCVCVCMLRNWLAWVVTMEAVASPKAAGSANGLETREEFVEQLESKGHQLAEAPLAQERSVSCFLHAFN